MDYGTIGFLITLLLGFIGGFVWLRKQFGFLVGKLQQLQTFAVEALDVALVGLSAVQDGNLSGEELRQIVEESRQALEALKRLLGIQSAVNKKVKQKGK